MNTVYLILFLSLLSLVRCQTTYFIVSGQYQSCSDLGGVPITDETECITAADAIGLDHGPTPTSTSSSSYPRGCFFNSIATSASSKLRINTNPSASLDATSSRKPICKDVSGQRACMTKVQGTFFADTNTASHYTCPSNFVAPSFSREGRLFWGEIPEEVRGVYKWALDTRAGVSDANDLDGNDIWEPISNFWTNEDSVLETHGVAYDQERDLMYFFYSSKYASCSNCYQRSLVRYNVGTGAQQVLVSDSFPYLCNDLSTPNFRSPITYDPVFNRLWWIGAGGSPVRLFSLDLAGPRYNPVLRAELSVSNDQFSQITTDCNGGVWFTDVFTGLWFYKIGWITAARMVIEPNLNGVTIIRDPGTNTQRFIVGRYWSLREYTFPAGTYSSFPLPPQRQAIGSDKDRTHNIQWDPQNEVMCFQSKTSDGDYIIACYDPNDSPNTVWNYIRGPFPRQQLAIRYGEYIFFDPGFIPPIPTLPEETTSMPQETTTVGSVSSEPLTGSESTVAQSEPEPEPTEEDNSSNEQYNETPQWTPSGIPPSFAVVSGQYSSCPEIGLEVITDDDECIAAADYFGFDHDTTPGGTSSAPAGCHYNTVASAPSYKIVMSSSSSNSAGNTRKPLCIDRLGLYSCYIYSAPSGVAPNPSDSTNFVCNENYKAPLYNRQAMSFYVNNEELLGMVMDYEELTQQGVTYDSSSVYGLVADQKNDFLYFFAWDKYYGCGVCYRRKLWRYHIDTDSLALVMEDSYPYMCNPMPDYTTRTPLAYDEMNNRLWWIAGDIEHEGLYSLDLDELPLIPVYRAAFSPGTSEFSDMVVDCKGGVWYTSDTNGLYYYREGWSTHTLMLSGSGYSGVTIIREEGSKEQKWIVGNSASLQSYTFPSTVGTSYPLIDGVSTVKEIHWDFQNEMMCVLSSSLNCYNPDDLSSSVSFYIGSQSALRIGNYFEYPVDDIETEQGTNTETENPSDQGSPTTAIEQEETDQLEDDDDDDAQGPSTILLPLIPLASLFL